MQLASVDTGTPCTRIIAELSLQAAFNNCLLAGDVTSLPSDSTAGTRGESAWETLPTYQQPPPNDSVPVQAKGLTRKARATAKQL